MPVAMAAGVINVWGSADCILSVQAKHVSRVVAASKPHPVFLLVLLVPTALAFSCAFLLRAAELSSFGSGGQTCKLTPTIWPRHSQYEAASHRTRQILTSSHDKTRRSCCRVARVEFCRRGLKTKSVTATSSPAFSAVYHGPDPLVHILTIAALYLWARSRRLFGRCIPTEAIWACWVQLSSAGAERCPVWITITLLILDLLISFLYCDALRTTSCFARYTSGDVSHQVYWLCRCNKTRCRLKSYILPPQRVFFFRLTCLKLSHDQPWRCCLMRCCATKMQVAPTH